MKVLLNVFFPHDEFNAAVRDGSVGKKLKKILDKIKPEAVYFTEQLGERSAVLVVEVPEASKIPPIAEPWFLTFNARVEFKLVMTPEDLEKGELDKLGKKWG